MTSFSERLQAAKQNRTRRTRDVEVILDESVAEEAQRLRSVIDAGDDDQRLGMASAADDAREALITLLDENKGRVDTFRFTRLPGRDWLAITSLHPPRPGVEFDMVFGFNWDAVCEAAAQAGGVRIEDGVEVPLRVEEPTQENPAGVNEWRDLFEAAPGGELSRIRDAIWELNVWGPQEDREAAVKNYGATTRSVSK